MSGEKLCYAVVFLSEAIIALWYFEHIFARKQSFRQIIVHFLFAYAVLFLISQFDITALNTLSFCLINFAILCQNYRCAVRTAILHSAFLSFIMMVGELVVAVLMNSFGHDFAAYTYDFSVTVTLAFFSKLLYLVLAFVGSRFFAPHKQVVEEPHMMVLFCSLPIFSAGISVFIVYLGYNTELNRSTGIMMIVNVFALLATNLLFLILYNYLQKFSAEYLAMQLSFQKEQADVEYYQTLQEQSESQQILIHDIKNHLRTIDGLAASNQTAEINDYISKLEASLGATKEVRLCADSILNLLLLRVMTECKGKGIDFQCDVRDNCVSFMDAPSMTTLYGNLLSNAIEAAEVSHEKLVELSVVRNIEQAIVFVSVVNSCDIPPDPNSNGFFRTRKDDAGIHGVGLKSIDRIVRKYDGVATMYYDTDNRKFHHVIQFAEN